MATRQLSQLLAQPFTLRQAVEAGLSRKRLTAMVLDRSVSRVLHGVYRHRDLPDDQETRLSAAKLVVRPFVVICDRTAGWLYDVDTFRYSELEILPPIETCVPPGRSRVRHFSCTGSERDLAPYDVQELAGLLVTTPLRTALDLGCLLGRRRALSALDAFLRQGDFDRDTLRAELPRFVGRRGVVQLRELIDLADSRSESSGESWTRLAIIDVGLPTPEPQWWVTWQGRNLFRLDLPYPKHRVCVEFDGVEFHDSTEARAYDERRRTWLRDHGWIIIVVRKEDFTAAAILRWTGELRDALISRGAFIR